MRIHTPIHSRRLATALAAVMTGVMAASVLAQTPPAPPGPGAQPAPRPLAPVVPPGKAPHEGRISPSEVGDPLKGRPIGGNEPGMSRGVPREVEDPPAVQRLSKPSEPPLPMPDIEDEHLAGAELKKGTKACPTTLVLKAPPPATSAPHGPDFPTSPGSQWIEPNFNGTQPDRHFRHTFHLRGCSKELCCELHKAKLEVKVKALLAGKDNRSPDAGNDSIAIWKNGSVQHWQYIWPNTGVTAGTVTTLTIPVQPSWLDGCRLSFQVQDDTAVLEAKLVVTGCCVKPNIKP